MNSGTFGAEAIFPGVSRSSHAVLLAIAGVLVAVVNWVRPGRPMTLRAGAWLFTTLAIWAALLRMPLYGVCSLLLAAGLARPISAAVASCSRHPRQARYALAGLLGLLIVLAALSSGRQALRKYRAVSTLPAPPVGARNVVLIVWDTVRASSLSLYGYHRDTTPNLQKWARTGVRYAMALVPAPWTYPSHSSFFTGQWPYKLNSQWNFSLDATYPTLAEYLASRGYQTVGFVANTRGCSYETGLDRGFAEYEDYPLTPRFLLGRTVAGSWMLKNLFGRGDFYDSKWIDLQSRDARGINAAFLEWLRRGRRDRPFFAFLNYFDAHSPYVPPAKYAGRFGMRPELPEDYELLFDIPRLATSKNWRRNFVMARDRYDDCIASLDDQLGRLLESLRGQGLLGQHVGDHYLGPRGIVRRSSRLRPWRRPLSRPDLGPAGDPFSGRTRGPHRNQPGQSARSAGHDRPPVGSLGRLTVPRSVAGGLLVDIARTGSSPRSPRPSRKWRRQPRSAPSKKPNRPARCCRCRW